MAHVLHRRSGTCVGPDLGHGMGGRPRCRHWMTRRSEEVAPWRLRRSCIGPLNGGKWWSWRSWRSWRCA